MMEMTCFQFMAELASGAPIPGGGGASAYAGALGVALGSMVANLTTGRKRYAEYEDDIQRILTESDRLCKELSELVQKDADVFEPLVAAYKLPTGTDEEKEAKAKVMEEALLAASLVPLEIMEKAYEGLILHEVLVVKGSRMAISDVGVGVQMLKTSILGAVMNIMINTKSMRDRSKADEIDAKARDIVIKGTALADKIYQAVEEALA